MSPGASPTVWRRASIPDCVWRSGKNWSEIRSKPPQRVIEPVSLAAFVVSLASFGWTVYRDLKKDRDAAKADGR
jgi:hypothetical protein